jgi:hypothetical protein
MWQYIKNIIPRIQKFSGELSHTEIFVDKPWALIDEDKNTHEYVFLRDHRLILSVNGKVVEGRWELLPTGKLLINRVTDQILLQQGFIDEGILLLKKSGTEDMPFMLINEKVITDKNPMKYLQKVEAKKLNYTLYKTEDGITLNNNNSSTGNFEVGATVTYDNGIKVNGELQLITSPDKYISLIDGVIQDSYFIKEYDTSLNVKLLVKRHEESGLSIGDTIINFKELQSNTLKNAFNDYLYKLVVFDNNGMITTIKEGTDLSDIALTIFFVFLLITLILLLSFYFSSKTNNTSELIADTARATVDTSSVRINEIKDEAKIDTAKMIDYPEKKMSVKQKAELKELDRKFEKLIYISIGSTEKEVLRVQGQPTSITDYGDDKTFFYELSSIHFHNGKVRGYDNTGGNLKIKIGD